MNIECECRDCGGTGVYCGFCEAKGTAVICLSCNGTGKRTYTERAFTGLKRRKGVTSVYNSRGKFIATGVGAVPERSVSYVDFLKGKRP